MDTQEVIDLLKKNNLLKIIDGEVDVELEIAHISYIEVKKEDSKALLFTNVVDKKNNKKFAIPVLTNIFCNKKAVDLFIGDVEKIAKKIEKFLKLKPPKRLDEKIDFFKSVYNLKNVPPKRLKKNGISQEVVIKNDINLFDLPILKTWDDDGGRFITMGQVYTQSLDGSMQNLGMYRLQVYNKTELGVHFQIHKDSNHFFYEYKKANKPMPVSIAIGGDPLYIWCGQAPLPIGFFELLLYGFIKNQNAKLVKCKTNDLYVPNDVDFVIEGFIDTNKLKIEGPFGDHTGYYTLKEEYPFMKVSCITHRKNPIYHATVVGKPPLEDKYMGFATQRIFLPLLKTTAPDLVDYYMPENGVFHNLILAKIKTLYPAHALQIMHSFWGVGQMSFVKHAIFVNKDAPPLTDKKIIPWILNRITPKSILITKGIIDALDHSSDEFAVGGKLGIDVTGDECDSVANLLPDNKLFEKIKYKQKDILDLRQFYIDTKNPICLIKVKKTKSMSEFIDSIDDLLKYIKILVIVDEKNNDLDNLYMILWRVVNNIDALRDIYIKQNSICVDATTKNSLDGFNKEWPDDVSCNIGVINSLIDRGLVVKDDKFFKQFQIIDL